MKPSHSGLRIQLLGSFTVQVNGNAADIHAGDWPIKLLLLAVILGLLH